MCGIAGILQHDGAPVDRALLARMTHSIAHRGPDGEGFFIDDEAGVGLGHRRLAILDLSAAGHQPMPSADERFWITFNGEVYNYRELAAELRSLGYSFRGGSDTEVILAAYEAWGEDCVRHFNGMFAFLIWDRVARKAFGARDRLGVKPFYYRSNAAAFHFASEIKALLEDPAFSRRPNQDAALRYLLEGACDGDAETMFAGVHQVPPGCLLKLENGNLSLRRYWDLADAPEVSGSDRELEARFFELFEDAVRLRLRSDVPVGTLLSGGLDSSSIVCVMDRLFRAQGAETRPRTFSSCFEDRRFDEREYILAVVERTGSDATFAFPDERDLFKVLPQLVWHQDEPFGSVSVFAQWNVFQNVAGKGVKVILDGQGADELLGGYHHFFPYLLADRLRALDLGGFSRELNAIHVRHGASKRWLLMTSFLRALGPRAMAWRQKQYHRKSAAALALAPAMRAAYPWTWDTAPRYEMPFRQNLYDLLTAGNLPALLHYEDRNSMAHSIESRTPFLDYRLVEFGFGLAADQKIRQGETKSIMRRALAETLPPAVRDRVDKMGFVTPQAEWLKTGVRSELTALFDSPSFAARGYFDVAQVKAAFERHCAGQADHSDILWRWINFEVWHRVMIDRSVDGRPAEKVSA